MIKARGLIRPVNSNPSGRGEEKPLKKYEYKLKKRQRQHQKN
jgi:hypothetical protein